jgi:hypothetical protein
MRTHNSSQSGHESDMVYETCLYLCKRVPGEFGGSSGFDSPRLSAEPEEQETFFSL